MQKINQNNKSAFSLIEISIVLLIIGIILAGITQGSIMIEKYRLSTARSMTQSSPVSSISDLIFWLEPTSTESFADINIEDGDFISSWRDINPQSSNKYNAVASGDNRPQYVRDCVSNLPCVQFDGSDDFLNMNSNLISIRDFTLFIVRKFDPNSGNPTIISSDYDNDITTNGMILSKAPLYEIVLSYEGANEEIDNIAIFGDGERTNLHQIYEEYSETNGGEVGSRINNGNYSTQSYSLSSGDINSKFAYGFFIGTNHDNDEFFSGSIAEIILFDRNLKTKEKEAVTNYLMNKWNL